MFTWPNRREAHRCARLLQALPPFAARHQMKASRAPCATRRHAPKKRYTSELPPSPANSSPRKVQQEYPRKAAQCAQVPLSKPRFALHIIRTSRNDAYPTTSSLFSPWTAQNSRSRSMTDQATPDFLPCCSPSISFTAATSAASSKPHSAYNSFWLPCSIQRSGMPRRRTWAW